MFAKIADAAILTDSAAITIICREDHRPALNRPSLQKIRVLILILDEYWKPGISIRAKEIERRLAKDRSIDMAERTVHFALDSLAEDGYLVVTQPGREKFYSINEEMDPHAVREEVVGLLGITYWTRPKAADSSDSQTPLTDVRGPPPSRMQKANAKGMPTAPPHPTASRPRLRGSK